MLDALNLTNEFKNGVAVTERLSKEGVFQVRSSTTTLFRQPMLPRQAATMRSMRSKCTQYCHQFSCAALVMTIAAAAAVATSSAGGGAAATTAGCARGTAPARIPLAFGVPSSMTRFGAVGRASSGSVSATQRTHPLSMNLADAPARAPSLTAAAAAASTGTSDDSLRGRRRRRPFGGADAGNRGTSTAAATAITSHSSSGGGGRCRTVMATTDLWANRGSSGSVGALSTGFGPSGGAAAVATATAVATTAAAEASAAEAVTTAAPTMAVATSGSPGAAARVGGVGEGVVGVGDGVGGGGGGMYGRTVVGEIGTGVGAGGMRFGVGTVVATGWHPAAEPDEEETDATQYDNWRRLRVEELVNDQFLTPGRVNEIMDPNNLQRHQYNTNPDSSFGAVFQLDTLVDVIPGLIYPAWLEVARALHLNAPTLETVQRGYGWTPEQMFLREFNWRLTQEELEGGIEIYERTVLRQALKYQPKEIPGSRRWLEVLRVIPMPMAVLSRLPASVVDAVLDKTGLAGYFPNRVTGEDEKFDDYRGYMLAAIKVKRSTMKCCAFDCRQEGMIKAHDADMRGVCRVGVMAAWELRLADYSVETFDDMTVLDFRQLFADREFEPGMMQLELEPEAAPMRKAEVATMVETETRWPDEEPEPETWSDRSGGDSGGGGGGRGGGGPRRRY